MEVIDEELTKLSFLEQHSSEFKYVTVLYLIQTIFLCDKKISILIVIKIVDKINAMPGSTIRYLINR